MHSPDNLKYKMLAVVGPTACGKTSLAVDLAITLNGEVISADSSGLSINATLNIPPSTHIAHLHSVTIL